MSDNEDDKIIHAKRKRKNITLGLIIASVVILFYVITILKLQGM